jgi:RecA/RadA recombinase
MSNVNYYSGLAALDSQLFSGSGAPAGTVLEIHGDTDTGKTALALWYCRTLLQQDPEALVGWLYTETPPTPYNLEWAGIDAGRFLVAPPSGNISPLEVAKRLIEGVEDSAGCNLVVIDSLAGLAELDAQHEPLALKRMIGGGLPPLARAAMEHGALVILLNQERQMARVKVISGLSRTLTRYVDARVRLRTGESLMRAATQTGFRVHFEIGKGAAEGAERTGRFNLHFARGLSDLRKMVVSLPGQEPIELPV